MIRLLLVLIAIVGFNGCVPKPTKRPAQSEISLALPQYESKSVVLPKSIKVIRPQGVSIETDKIIYVDTNGVRRPYAYYRWEDTLARQLHERLVLALVQKGIFGDVAKDNETINANWLLEIDVLEFVQWMESDTLASIHFSARMRLVEAKEKRGLDQHLVSFVVPMDGLGVVALKNAYNRAMKKWLDETLNWIEQIGEEKYAR